MTVPSGCLVILGSPTFLQNSTKQSDGKRDDNQNEKKNVDKKGTQEDTKTHWASKTYKLNTCFKNIKWTFLRLKNQIHICWPQGMKLVVKYVILNIHKQPFLT